MAGRVRAHDWAATPLGPVEAWPQSLRTAVELVLASPLVSSLVCGPERLLIYNDAAATLYGARHPAALGRPLPEVFPEGWQVGAAFYERVFAGEAVQVAAQPLNLRGEPGRPADVFDAYLTPVRDEAGRVVAGHMIGFEVGVRLRAEAALRESEARQAFLLRLSDALRPLADFTAIQGAASRILGEHLGADRAYYVGLDEARQVATVEQAYSRDEAPSLIGEHAFTAYGATLDLLRAGQVVAFDDVEAEPRIQATDLPSYRALGLGAFLSSPLIKDGELVCAMCVVSARPRRWTMTEAALVEETAERTWAAVARARAEATLRQSEERQAYLLQLSDALRPLTATGDIGRVATRLLGEHLKADRCYLSLVYEDGSGMCVREEYLRAGASSVLGDYTFAQFGDFVGPELHAGRILAVENVAALTGLCQAERASYESVEIGAYLLIPLVRDGRLAAFLAISHRTPRTWSEADKAIAQQTADRLWTARERGRAEEALRTSEDRLSRALKAGELGAWELDLATLDAWRSPEHDRIFGYAAPLPEWTYDRFLGHVVPEDRDRVDAAFQAATAGASSAASGAPTARRAGSGRRAGSSRARTGGPGA